MALITAEEFRAAARFGDSAEEVAETTRVYNYAVEAVERYASGASDAAKSEAVVRLGSHLLDQPTATRGDAYASAGRNSGAWSILLPYRVRRAGTVGARVEAAQEAVGVPGNPVVNVEVLAAEGEIVVTFADGSTENHDLPAGMGGGTLDQTARTAAAAAQTAANENAAAIAALDIPTLPMPPSPAEARGGTATALRLWSSELIRENVDAALPALRGTRVYVQTTEPADGMAGDIWLADLTTAHPIIYEHNGSAWVADYGFYGGRVHFTTDSVNANTNAPTANAGDLLFEEETGSDRLTIWVRLPGGPPYWGPRGEVFGSRGSAFAQTTPVNVNTDIPSTRAGDVVLDMSGTNTVAVYRKTADSAPYFTHVGTAGGSTGGGGLAAATWATVNNNDPIPLPKLSNLNVEPWARGTQDIPWSALDGTLHDFAQAAGTAKVGHADIDFLDRIFPLPATLNDGSIMKVASGQWVVGVDESASGGDTAAVMELVESLPSINSAAWGVLYGLGNLVSDQVQSVHYRKELDTSEQEFLPARLGTDANRRAVHGFTRRTVATYQRGGALSPEAGIIELIEDGLTTDLTYMRAYVPTVSPLQSPQGIIIFWKDWDAASYAAGDTLQLVRIPGTATFDGVVYAGYASATYQGFKLTPGAGYRIKWRVQGSANDLVLHAGSEMRQLADVGDVDEVSQNLRREVYLLEDRLAPLESAGIGERVSTTFTSHATTGRYSATGFTPPETWKVLLVEDRPSTQLFALMGAFDLEHSRTIAGSLRPAAGDTYPDLDGGGQGVYALDANGQLLVGTFVANDVHTLAYRRLG